MVLYCRKGVINSWMIAQLIRNGKRTDFDRLYLKHNVGKGDVNKKIYHEVHDSRQKKIGCSIQKSVK